MNIQIIIDGKVVSIANVSTEYSQNAKDILMMANSTLNEISTDNGEHLSVPNILDAVKYALVN